MIAVVSEFVKDIERILGRKLSEEELDILTRAYDYARVAHEGQFRDSGDEFFTHVVEVAKLVAELKLDTTSIAAALLHDVVEDCGDKGYTIEGIEEEFGPEVARIVDGVSKISELKIEDKIEDENLSSYMKLATLQKMILAMASDVRVILVKLCDRLHNMRTLHFVKDPEKIQKKARETLKIYAPVAHKLGIHRIMWELEDLSFKFLHPHEYRMLKSLVSRKLEERMEITEHYKKTLEEAMRARNIKATVSGRVKHFYSIWRKMTEKQKSFDEIYDLIALRVITEDETSCYSALGIVHSIWSPVPGRFKDYIAVPKSNGYKSLHTTVITERGEYLEIQIRSRKMHEEAEYGLAAHWAYKDGLTAGNKWISRLVEWQNDVISGLSHLKDLETELQMDEVFVFTPKGEPKHLPKGSTPIDFAYTIHTEVGHHFAGAKVNGKLVPIDYELQMGDVVEIIVNKNSPGPSLDWLKYARSPRTRAKIRKFFKEKYHQELVERGKEVLRRLAKRKNMAVEEILSDERIKAFMTRNGIGSADDLVVRLGEGSVTYFDLLRVLDPIQEAKRKRRSPRVLKRSPVIVDGLAGIDVIIAKCCNPIPGDRIVGIVSRRGVTIHKTTCRNVRNISTDRMVDVSWAYEALDKPYFATNLLIEARPGSLAQIVDHLERMNIAQKLEVEKKDPNIAFVKLQVFVKDSYHLEEIMNNVRSIPGVEHIRRE
ncbi:MAG TPA: bifunctional (p)ppGpp synthetase/guanosine-3',5'-bis(diphosphate) 3'-pyrophosphohydrolase [Thermotogae bacterium]|nr:bifunctional (p)ppGpp synthetase/guanosine-3',5'-bis(diphosphate) 3'-pyrophosphohydrolase [Thermotogota bacterium]